jgi:hypothetical protein
LYTVNYIPHAGSRGRYYTIKIYWRNTIIWLSFQKQKY